MRKAVGLKLCDKENPLAGFAICEAVEDSDGCDPTISKILTFF